LVGGPDPQGIGVGVGVGVRSRRTKTVWLAKADLDLKLLRRLRPSNDVQHLECLRCGCKARIRAWNGETASKPFSSVA
jgi:hypothetical protein